MHFERVRHCGILVKVSMVVVFGAGIVVGAGCPSPSGSPVVTNFAVNSGAAQTNSRTVTLTSTCTNGPVDYMACESATFAGASWLPYSCAASFVLSKGNGTKTVYFRTRNEEGQSSVKSDSIVLSEPSQPGTWARIIGGETSETAYCIAQTSDEGFILAGYLDRDRNTGTADAYLVKLDAYGNQMWARTLGGLKDDWARSVAQTPDGGYVIAGITWSFGAGMADMYLVKTDSQGHEVWAKAFGGDYLDGAISMDLTADGGYIMAGNTSDYALKSDAYVVKTDSHGNKVWAKTFGGAAGDDANCVIQTTDGGYMIGGGTSSYGAGASDMYLVKMDKDGNQEWSKTFGGPNSDWITEFAQTPDGGYILAGRTGSYGAGGYNGYLVKTDAQGNQVWAKTFGGDKEDSVNSVGVTEDGGYVLAGGTFSWGAGSYDVYLVKTDAQGVQEWAKTFGGADGDAALYAVPTVDGGYAIAGERHGYNPEYRDIYVIKTDAEGNAPSEPE